MYQKDHPAPQKLKFCMKKNVFFYSKRPPSPAKSWSIAWKNDKKLTKSWPKKWKTTCKTRSFAWKIENRPTYEDFEKKNLDPQLHQIFKPTRKFICTFLLIYQFKLRHPLNHIKVSKKYKTKKLLHFNFTSYFNWKFFLKKGRTLGSETRFGNEQVFLIENSF